MAVRTPLAVTAATAEALGAAYAAFGSVVDIRGMGSITIHVTAAGTGDTLLNVFVDPTATTAPADATGSGMHQLIDLADQPPAGVEMIITVPTTEKMSIPLHGVSGNFLAFKAKYSATDGTATIVVTGNVESGGSAVAA